jgi:hypothetical protein
MIEVAITLAICGHQDVGDVVTRLKARRRKAKKGETVEGTIKDRCTRLLSLSLGSSGPIATN